MSDNYDAIFEGIIERAIKEAAKIPCSIGEYKRQLMYWIDQDGPIQDEIAAARDSAKEEVTR